MSKEWLKSLFNRYEIFFVVASIAAVIVCISSLFRSEKPEKKKPEPRIEKFGKDYHEKRIPGSGTMYEIIWKGHTYLGYSGGGVCHAGHCPCRGKELPQLQPQAPEPGWNQDKDWERKE
jgi:hypothetical protein